MGGLWSGESFTLRFGPGWGRWVPSSRLFLSCVDASTDEKIFCSSSESTRIKSSMQVFFIKDMCLTCTKEAIIVIPELRAIVDRHTVDGGPIATVIGPTFFLHNQYLRSWKTLFQICGYAVVGIAIPCYFFTLSFRLTLVIMFFMCVTLVQSFASLRIIDATQRFLHRQSSSFHRHGS